ETVDPDPGPGIEEVGDVNLSFSTRVLNGYELPRELDVFISDDFDGIYTLNKIREAVWEDISDKFRFPLTDTQELTPAGSIDISEYVTAKKPFFVAFRYKTAGVPPADRMGRNWRVEEFSLTNHFEEKTNILANHHTAGWVLVENGEIDPGRGATIQQNRLNFLANNINREVPLEIWAISKAMVINLNAHSGTYYVDQNGGNDNNNGTTPLSAWKTLEAVNSREFAPGAKILFKSGGTWIGQLSPNGSGMENSPIIIDQYGVGAKPLINANGALGAVISLNNQSFWEINNLELINDAAEMGIRNGINITASNYGLLKHIHLKKLHIHHIKGTVNNGAPTAGIFIRTLNDDEKDTRFDDILIENCEIHHVQNQGISFSTPGERGAGYNHPSTPDWERRRFTNVMIRNNVIHHISKNAMILKTVDGGIVEHNLCYETALDVTGNTIFSYGTKGTVFQYNEGYLNRSPGGDGSLYDADLGSPETVWQYSYSHDNAHGLMWFIPDERDNNIIVRYNISQNDKGYLVRVNNSFVSAYIYNNTFYIDKELSPSIIQEAGNSNVRTYHFYNNIIYNLSSSSIYNFVGGNNTTRIFSNNLFYGYHPANEPNDPFKITADPLFVAPGTGKTGLNTVGGYQLRPNSPAIRAGKAIPDNGERDYFGLPVSADEPPNIGFYNGPGNNNGIPDENFHLYLLIGQSNMAGRGTITPEYGAVSHPRVKMLNQQNEWVPAKHPLHFDIAKPGVGPGLQFAIKMAEANPDITIGLIPSAVGATGIDLWQPGAFDSAKDVYPYDDALARAKTAMLSGVMKGILWHQGEGNSAENSSVVWPGKVEVLVNRLRNEFMDSRLPFVIGELSYERPTSHFINDKLPQLILDVPYTGIASAEGLTAFDVTHFDSPSTSLLGERYAEQMIIIQNNK
ncbi:sialate O-acetylesterase, partial [Proteiniphilum sp. UBA5384]|uniref:sialate O-acetylesterase n=1 Tax=Proteiniphilum sp. UBA5384 TaxID=1947279 RepID=UPI0025D72CDD